jgi:hypothetical protein
MGEQEYAESRRGEIGARFVDNWNWIFKKAKGEINNDQISMAFCVVSGANVTNCAHVYLREKKRKL